MDYMTWQDFVYVSLQIIALVIAILSYLHRNDNHHHLFKSVNMPIVEIDHYNNTSRLSSHLEGYVMRYRSDTNTL